jgi:hypothetical protein
MRDAEEETVKNDHQVLKLLPYQREYRKPGALPRI